MRLSLSFYLQEGGEEEAWALAQHLTTEANRLHDLGVETKSKDWQKHWLALAANMHALSSALHSAIGEATT